MKLLRAEIKNFRLLKDVEIQFSTDSKRNITIVRADNDSGKTTLHTALQWGLFGDVALPGPRKNFRMSPIDAPNNKEITVRVELDYEIAVQDEDSEQFRIIRFCTEKPRGKEFDCVDTSHVKLFKFTFDGHEKINHPEVQINSHLPEDIREVFFTDGDKALNFIKGVDSEKKVENALRQMLGLNAIENLQKHMEISRRKISKKISDNSNVDDELKQVYADIETTHEKGTELQDSIKQKREGLENAKEQLEDLELKLEDALRGGNKEDLRKERKETQEVHKSLQDQLKQIELEHANLFKDELIGKLMIEEKFQVSKSILDGLHEQGEIPLQTIPVLMEHLNQKVCICGENLSEENPDGSKRRQHINNLIETNRNTDNLRKKVTELFYNTKDGLLIPTQSDAWSKKFKSVYKKRQKLNQKLKEYGKKEAEIEAKIEKMGDVDVHQIQESKKHYQDKHSKLISSEAVEQEALKHNQETISALEVRKEKLLKSKHAGNINAVQNDLVKDLLTLIDGTITKLKTEEIEKVSKLMNEFFLEMIRTAPVEERGLTVINETHVSPNFKIEVISIENKTLDLSTGLNGASQRALTIAFVLALSKVSGVNAPNVVDTPFGMMDDFVKNFVLSVAAQQSSQLVLFLTRSEISGCQDNLSELVGQSCTFSNPAKYPTILKNKPKVDSRRIMICKCDHKSHCDVCESKMVI